ncbi:homocysteine S-methyltransferase-like [Culicoides brevitarsis]|uniref:homocysteine S-methyltransferase-like n=1 Tax=Culicoides brevitarsis TaxID=469753 RepID=UPI00307B488A
MPCDGKVLVTTAGFIERLIKNAGEDCYGDELWASKYNFTHPEAVIQATLDMLKNGSNVIFTNTYQSSVDLYKKCLKLSDEQCMESLRQTVGFACTARDRFLKESKPEIVPLIGGAIGPYGACLHDGSEYTGAYIDKVSREFLRDWHRPRVAALVEGGADFLAVFTIPCLAEAEVIVDLICTEFAQTKFWISLQCKDDTHVAHGEKFSEAVLAIWKKVRDQYKSDKLMAIGVNCLPPANVSPLLKSLEGHTIPFMVAANSGETYDVQKGWHGKADCKPLESFIPEWIALGAKFIGGCCRTDISDIGKIKKAIELS